MKTRKVKIYKVIATFNSAEIQARSKKEALEIYKRQNPLSAKDKLRFA